MTASGTAKQIPITNAWYLLLYAWDMARWRGVSRYAEEQSPTLLGLLARVLHESTRQLLRDSLGRAFLDRADTVRGVRGRIDFATSLRTLAFESGKAHCRFPELQIDTLRNRILRSTLDRLSRDERVDHSDPARAHELKRELRELVREMDGVTLVPVTDTMFGQVQLTRSEWRYALPLAICALVHRLELPTQVAGDHVLAALLEDEVKFSALFERFVRNFWKTHLPGYRVESERLEWHDELGCTLAPGMCTDITLTRIASRRRLVVDTKYYKETLSAGMFGAARITSGHLYQVYAYLRTQEERGPEFREAEGMLLYPTTSVELHEAMRVQGHRIRVATIDLSLAWPDIHARLLALPEN
jgi:5-methylcytosine-specific restriction enzyme subunit McrC